VYAGVDVCKAKSAVRSSNPSGRAGDSPLMYGQGISRSIPTHKHLFPGFFLRVLPSFVTQSAISESG
jgi:hypothetical protein